MPLVNVPFLDYTLEFLVAAKVQEIFVFVKCHAEMIKKYLVESKWTKQKKVKIRTIVVPEADGVGDIMRELDAKSLIQTDFILVSGNVVSNMKLDHVLELHKKRKVALKNDAIMTMVMKRASVYHRSRALGESSVVAIDPLTSECVQHQVQKFGYGLRPKKFSVDLANFKSRRNIQVHNDLIDCQIDICSVEVPALFTENFDYQDIRSDFVKGILTSDLLKKKIHVHIIGEEYASRVRSTRLYDSVSKDIISRWAFPIVPDNNIHLGDDYRYYRGHVYREPSVFLARSAVIEEEVVLGSQTKVGDATKIKFSTIGRNCNIGKNVNIEGSYIWDNVKIGDNCVIKQSIIANDATIKDNVTIARGCILSFGVKVGPNITLNPFTKLTVIPPPNLEGSIGDNISKEISDADIEYENPPKSTSPVIDPNIVGEEGNAFKWDPVVWHDTEDEFSDDEMISNETSRDIPSIFQIGFDPKIDSVVDGFTLSLDEDSMSEASSTDVGSNFSAISEDEEDSGSSELHKHLKEVKETLKRAIVEGHTLENALLELNALKMACNITFHDLRNGCIQALLSFVNDEMEPKDAKDTLLKVVNNWSQCLARLSLNFKDQEDIFWLTLKYCTQHDEVLKPLFIHVIMSYYQNEVIEEDTILNVYSLKSNWSQLGGEDWLSLWNSLGQMVEWLKNAESESSDDD